VLGEVRTLVQRAVDLPEIEASSPIPHDAHAAEREAWAWYQEWSAIARARITDGRVLRRLGLGKRGRPPGSRKKSADAERSPAS